MVKEIGGYIELDTYRLPMLHKDALALNAGRNALAYLFKTRNIKKIKIPYLICDSIISICKRERVSITYYSINEDFTPVERMVLEDDEWLYLVNFYGQVSNDTIEKYVVKYERVIVDQANGYFEKPIKGIDTIYTCRKWFGVTDGAFLYTDKFLDEELPRDESYNRLHFLLGRYERTASEFYNEYVENNKLFIREPIKKMSKLTENLLCGIDYEFVKQRRISNFTFLHKHLGNYNKLKLQTAAFMYPFMVENGSVLKSFLQERKIYIPTLWPSVFRIANQKSIEYSFAENILPIPIDQRYDNYDMQMIIQYIKEYGYNG